MKKNTKKGFTLVELVIVIAVIAILSAILIPTFGDIISNANETAYQKAADSGFTEALDKYATKVSFDYAIVVYYDGGIEADAADGGDVVIGKGTSRAYKIDASKNITLITEDNVSTIADSLLTLDGSTFTFKDGVTMATYNPTSEVKEYSPSGSASDVVFRQVSENGKVAIAFFKTAA